MLDTVLYVKGKNWNIFTCNNNDKKEYFKFIELFIQMINLTSYRDKLCLGTKQKIFERPQEEGWLAVDIFNVVHEYFICLNKY